WFMPRWTQAIITRLGATQVSEPEVKFIFFVLFLLGGFATMAKSEAVLPAYQLGLVIAGVSARDALRAKESRDPEAFAASGFAELEKHLVQFLANEKRETLKRSRRSKGRRFDRAAGVGDRDRAQIVAFTN